jgi:glycosyltransferase involved in cell wall biosynthesis
MKTNKIKIIVSFYNPGKFFDVCINNLLLQDYDDYEILFIDDSSTDESYNKIPAGEYKVDTDGKPLYDDGGELIIEYSHPLLEKTKCKKMIAWRSPNRNGDLVNFHNGVFNFVENDDDIVVLLNGHDWLMNKLSLSQINAIYNAKNCWMTFGGHSNSKGKHEPVIFLDEPQFNNLRNNHFKINSPLTFRGGLYRRMIEADPNYNAFKNENNQWYNTFTENVLAIPLMECAGFENVYQNDKAVYVKNTEIIANKELEMDIIADLENKPNFNKIDNYILEQKNDTLS